LVSAPGDHNNDFAKLISVLDLNLLRDVGTIINETVRCPGVGAIPSLTSGRSTGRNPSPLVVFASGRISMRNWTTENIYTLGLIPSSCVSATLFPSYLPFYGTPSQSKVAQQVASTAPDSVETLNVVYFPQLGG